MPSPLAELIERFTGRDGAHETDMPELALYRWSHPTDALPALMRPSVCVIAQGAKRVLLGEVVYHYDPDHFLVAAADVPVCGQVIRADQRAPYLSLSIQLDQALVSELAAQAHFEGPTTPITSIAVSSLEQPLLDAMIRFVALLETPRDRGVLAPLILREIIYRLLVSDQGPRLRQIVVGDGSAQRIFHALRWLRTHYTEPLRIEDLAREVRLRPSALHQHFKSVTSMSPLQYQKQLRLHEARRLMLSESLDASDACFRVGYESPSQFSREYRRLFGAPPRQDVADVRQRVSLAAELPAR